MRILTDASALGNKFEMIIIQSDTLDTTVCGMVVSTLIGSTENFSWRLEDCIETMMSRTWEILKGQAAADNFERTELSDSQLLRSDEESAILVLTECIKLFPFSKTILLPVLGALKLWIEMLLWLNKRIFSVTKGRVAADKIKSYLKENPPDIRQITIESEIEHLEIYPQTMLTRV